MTADYYRILEVDKDASIEVIKKAYRALSLKHHPDRASGDSDAALTAMAELNQAYEVLSDPVRRQAYDASRVTWEVWLDDGLVGLARNWLSVLNK